MDTHLSKYPLLADGARNFFRSTVYRPHFDVWTVVPDSDFDALFHARLGIWREYAGTAVIYDMTMTEDRLKEIERLAREATPGPWEQEYTANNAGMALAEFRIPGHNAGKTVEMLADDAAFIVAARATIPELLDEVWRLRAQLAGLGGA